MPHDPIVVGMEFVEGETGQHDTVLVTQYEAPAGDDGEVIADPFREMDLALARKVKEWLEKRYVGYMWDVRVDGAQKMAYFRLGILMSGPDWYAINLTTNEEFAEVLTKGAGDLLERFNLPRTHYDVARWLEARQNHSRLVRPWQRIPG